MSTYYDNLPKKRMAAGVLLFNENDELLIVKPTYREDWLIPGGAIEENESPKEAARRELKEETDLEVDSLELIAVDYKPKTGVGEAIVFLFNGGQLSKESINNIKLPEEELKDYKFVPPDQMGQYLSEGMNRRIVGALEALKNNRPVYLEKGKMS